jgi:hypothetical protein
MTSEILTKVCILAALLIFVAWPIAYVIAAVGSDFQREFEQEQSDERSERNRW